MYEHEDDELQSAIFGDQPEAMSPLRTTATATGAPNTPAPQAPAGGSMFGALAGQGAQPQQPATPPGGDMFAAIYGAQPQAGLGAAPPQDGGAPLKVGQATPGGQAGPDDRVASYRDAVSRISQSSDPATQARERDTLARSVFSDLQAAGHDAKWEGDVLVVDGRRYTVGGGSYGTGSGGNTGIGGGLPSGPVVDAQATAAGQPSGGFVSAASPFTGQQGPNAMRGLVTDRAFAATDTNSVKDAFTRASAGVMTDIRGLSKEQAADVARRELVPYLESQGVRVHDIVGDQMLIETAEEGLVWKDYIYQAGSGEAAFHWENVGGGNGAGPSAGPGVVGVGAPGASGVPLGAGAPGPGAAPPPAASPEFALTGPTYEPGAITDDDIPDFTTEGLAAQMGGYTPERYEVGDLGVGEVEDDVDGLMRAILANPESLDPATIERMKVSGREEAADMERADMEEMTALGFEHGIDSSPWLASQRLARRGQTSEAVARNNRTVDIEAARTNTADRRAAAGLGSSHLSEVGTRKRGEESLRQSAAGMNEANSFNAAKLKSDNVTNAAKLSLDAAAERGDRMALRESVNQAAAELGQSADKIMLDYVTSTRDDLTRRYGIDVDAALKREGLSVDWANLRQRGAEFQQELAFKMRQLALNHEVDMGGLALGYDTLDQRAYEADLGAMMGGIYG